jgi:hypothetical protein
MPGVNFYSRVVLASTATILSLALAGPASAGGPLSGLTQTVSDATTGLGQTVETVGSAVQGVTGAQQAPSSGPDKAAAPVQEEAPAADANAAPQPAAPAPTAVNAVTAVARTVVAETVPALAATANRVVPAASDTAGPVVGEALGNVRAVAGSAVAATGAAVTQVANRTLATVATVTEPVLPVTGALLDQVGATLSTANSGLVASVGELVAPPRSQGSNGPAPPSGGGTGAAPGAVPPGQGADDPAASKRKRKAAGPGTPAAEWVVSPLALDDTSSLTAPGSPRVGARDGNAVPSLAPLTRRVASSTGSSSAGATPGFAFAAFAVIAGLFALAAPGLGRRLKLWPALVRPLAFVSPPDRPG